jgi:putative phage-type endonuclease
MNKITYSSEAEWLSLRLDDITSTESAALFGLSPYVTEFELWHRKKAHQHIEFEENNRMKWGQRLQNVIAEGIAEDLNITVQPMTYYGRHSDCPGMGASFDYEVVNHPDGPGILEIKCVDTRAVKAWEADEAPAHIEAQVQHQMEVAEYEWCIIAALVGGNDPRIIYRKRDHDVGRILREKITAFWQSIKDDKPPEIDYARDTECVIRLHQSAGESVLTADEELIGAMTLYQTLATEANKAIRWKEEQKARILQLVGDKYNKVVSDTLTLSCGMTKATAPTIITPDMIGQSYGGRKSYRDFRINTIKKEK